MKSSGWNKAVGTLKNCKGKQGKSEGKRCWWISKAVQRKEGWKEGAGLAEQM